MYDPLFDTLDKIIETKAITKIDSGSIYAQMIYERLKVNGASERQQKQEGQQR